MLSENQVVQLAAIPFAGGDGFLWNLLHDEREEICEALLKASNYDSTIHREQLEERLRHVDNALDELMSIQLISGVNNGH